MKVAIMFTCLVITGPNENAIHNTFRYFHYFPSEKMDKIQIDVQIARVLYARIEVEAILMNSNIATRRVLRFIDATSSHPPFQYEMQTYLRYAIQTMDSGMVSMRLT